MAPAAKSVLLLTLPPGLGGVGANARMVEDVLVKHGYPVTVAWRAYYSEEPNLSVPVWQVLTRRPAIRAEVDGSVGRIAVGTWLPEFEWAHHQPWAPWRALLEGHRAHVVVSGNNLAGWGPTALDLPSLQWIASAYGPDRVDRIRRWPTWRRIYDAALNSWVSARQEVRTLERADTLSISGYTHRGLQQVTAKARLFGVLAIPVDTERFAPDGRTSRTGRKLRIGFNGRISDPRKNMPLLVKAFARAASLHPDIELHIRGDMPREEFIARFDAVGIADKLVVQPSVPFARMPDWYRSLDIFALASHQEGLGIVGTEAMACGAVVVSTRCGGPEDYVLDNETGLLSGFDEREFADKLIALIGDTALRARLCDAGIAFIRARHAQAKFERGFMEAFSRLYGTL
jgi:glycosyltransferase involved in cell wall biosynthesis